MKHTLVKPDGTLGQTRDFADAPPAIAPNKGRWLPDNPPAFNPMTHTIARVEPVSPGATSIPYSVTLRQPADVLADKLAELAALRYEKETAGITVAGASIKTDRESQATLASAYTSMKNGLLAQVDWKASNGWVTVTLAQLEPIAQAVAAHVQACFSRERALASALQAIVDNPVAVADYDISTGWPA